MRERLSKLITEAAEADPRFIVLTGDHGHQLFDELRSKRPDQFLNVGIAEPAMVGYAAGLAKTGFKPLVYGLASFVPMKALEQIKLDLCLSMRPVIILGDAAGLVHSTLGNSHQCAEDIAVLRALPNIRIYSPADDLELEECFREAMSYRGPSYIRLGKSDLGRVKNRMISNPVTRLLYAGFSKRCIVSTGAMVKQVYEVAREMEADLISVPRIKPIHLGIIPHTKPLVVVEEHARPGGLFSALCEAFADQGAPMPHIKSVALWDNFTMTAGDYQHALSERGMGLSQLKDRIKAAFGIHA